MNKEIQKAFSLVEPTEEQKEKMLQNILHKRKKFYQTPLFRFAILGVYAVMFIVLFQVRPDKNTPRTLKMAPISTSFPVEITWNGECYQLTSLEQFSISSFLGEQEMNNEKVSFYAHKEDTSIIYLLKNGNYQPYKKIVCQGKD